MERKRRILKHYEPRIGTGRENFDVLDWASVASQKARFAVLAGSVELDGKSLLDVGCGLGDMLAFLQSQGIEIDYTGIDLSWKMVQEARRLHKDAKFFCGDLFTGERQPCENPVARATFDIVYCSGVFNLNLGNNRQFLPGAVGRLMLLADQYVVFNLLHRGTPHQDDDYAYYDPDEVLAGIAEDRWENRLVEGYLPNDFTVICRRIGLDAVC